jgi:ABC-type Mn2+/Zn2+ transport system permease subunit
MAAIAALVGAAGAVAGLGISLASDIPGGPAIVLVLAATSLAAIGWNVLKGGRG